MYFFQSIELMIIELDSFELNWIEWNGIIIRNGLSCQTLKKTTFIVYFSTVWSFCYKLWNLVEISGNKWQATQRKRHVDPFGKVRSSFLFFLFSIFFFFFVQFSFPHNNRTRLVVASSFCLLFWVFGVIVFSQSWVPLFLSSLSVFHVAAATAIAAPLRGGKKGKRGKERGYLLLEATNCAGEWVFFNGSPKACFFFFKWKVKERKREKKRSSSFEYFLT